MSELPLEQTSFPGVYRRGARFVAIYRRGGRQHKETAATVAEAREIKLARDAEARAKRRGPTLHAYALGWLDRYAGSGRDSLRERTRREYRRLLSTFALRYFDRGVRLRDLDPPALQGLPTGSRIGQAETAASPTARSPTPSCRFASRWTRRWPRGCSSETRRTCLSCPAVATGAPGSSRSGASSPASSSPDCSPRCRRSGGRSSSCSR